VQAKDLNNNSLTSCGATVTITKLWDNVEDGFLDGTAALNVTGNGLANNIAGNDVVISNSGTFLTGYHHVAAVFDSSNSLFQLYLDGAFVSQTNTTNQVSDIGTNVLWLGRSEWSGNTYLDGAITRELAGLGMEAAGVVEAVGDGVTHVKAGDRVAYAGGAHLDRVDDVHPDLHEVRVEP